MESLLPICGRLKKFFVIPIVVNGVSFIPYPLYKLMQISNLLNVFWEEPQNEYVLVINKVCGKLF